MRLLIVANPNSPLTAAAKIAKDKGATVFHAQSCEQAIAMLWSGHSADLLLVEIGINIRNMVRQLDAEPIHAPIVACGTSNDIRAAVAAIHAGAMEYISLLSDPEIIAVMLVAVAESPCGLIDGDDAVVLMVKVAEQVKPSGVMVRRTIAEVERNLILETLGYCLGNRTHTAFILGISIRTLRNKLHDYAAKGIPVPPAPVPSPSPRPRLAVAGVCEDNRPYPSMFGAAGDFKSGKSDSNIPRRNKVDADCAG
jgi:DNA-binding NtrC family response regulator